MCLLVTNKQILVDLEPVILKDPIRFPIREAVEVVLGASGMNIFFLVKNSYDLKIISLWKEKSHVAIHHEY